MPEHEMPQHEMTKPSRLERLTNLALALAEADHSLTLEEIISSVPGYPAGSNSETTRAAFERDKRALRESGIEIDVDTSTRAVAAYRSSGRRGVAAEFDFSEDDVALWMAALRVTEARSNAHRDALAKLATITDPETCLAASSDTTQALLQLALIERRHVVVAYRRRLLDLEPFGLTCDGDSTVLIARPRRSGDERPNAYRLEALTSLPALGTADSFELPASFDPEHRAQSAPRRKVLSHSSGTNTSTLSVGERYRRLLAILSYLGAVGSARLDLIADLFQMSRAAVVEDLERAACCGVAPFSPDQLLDLFIDEDAVFTFGLERFRCDAALTIDEIGAVIEALGVLSAAPGLVAPKALQRASEKLSAAIGSSVFGAPSTDHHRRALWPSEWTSLLSLRVDEVSPSLNDVLVGTPRRGTKGFVVKAYFADRRWQRDLLGHLESAPETERRAA